MSVFNTFAGPVAVRRALSGSRHVFFVGIGGIQMHALALILKGRGFYVSGSDRSESREGARLRAAGIPVYIGHDATHIAGADCVIYTLAADPRTPELVAAAAAGIPLFSRADLLGALMADFTTRIAVAGAHGKSTVTGMLAALLEEGGKDPTVVGGAPLSRGGEVFSLGGGEIFLAEACEYKDSFLCLSPTVALLLNAEWEHADYFQSEEQLFASFSRFLEGAGTLILPEEGLPEGVAPPAGEGRRILRFGLGEGADARAMNIGYKDGMASFDFVFLGEMLGRLSLSVPGEHNLKNALAALACGGACGVSFSSMRRALANFRGVPRRVEHRGSLLGMTVYEDYAHHPTEILASLAALRGMMGSEGRLLCVYQPHTYSRTVAFFDGFARALGEADRVYLLPIYAAREQNESGVSAEALAAAIPTAAPLSGCEAILPVLMREGRAGDTVVFMGAGDIHEMLARLPLEA